MESELRSDIAGGGCPQEVNHGFMLRSHPQHWWSNATARWHPIITPHSAVGHPSTVPPRETRGMREWPDEWGEWGSNMLIAENTGSPKRPPVAPTSHPSLGSEAELTVPPRRRKSMKHAELNEEWIGAGESAAGL